MPDIVANFKASAAGSDPFAGVSFGVSVPGYTGMVSFIVCVKSITLIYKTILSPLDSFSMFRLRHYVFQH